VNAAAPPAAAEAPASTTAGTAKTMYAQPLPRPTGAVNAAAPPAAAAAPALTAASTPPSRPAGSTLPPLRPTGSTPSPSRPPTTPAAAPPMAAASAAPATVPAAAESRITPAETPPPISLSSAQSKELEELPDEEIQTLLTPIQRRWLIIARFLGRLLPRRKASRAVTAARRPARPRWVWIGLGAAGVGVIAFLFLSGEPATNLPVAMTTVAPGPSVAQLPDPEERSIRSPTSATAPAAPRPAPAAAAVPAAASVRPAAMPAAAAVPAAAPAAAAVPAAAPPAAAVPAAAPAHPVPAAAAPPAPREDPAPPVPAPAPVPAPPVAAKAEPAGPGSQGCTADIDSTPKADVEVGGRSLGSTPLRGVAVPCGNSSLTISHPRYRPVTRSLNATPQAPVQVAARLVRPPARLQLIPASAAWKVNGRALPAGTQSYEVSRFETVDLEARLSPKKTWRRNFYVKAAVTRVNAR
jgi:PEGA domain